MPTLANLVENFDSNAFVFADAGNGAGFGEDGQAIDYDQTAAEHYGHIDLMELETPINGCNFASDWIVTGEGTNPYRFRIMF